jgi:hypothetical protein
MSTPSFREIEGSFEIHFESQDLDLRQLGIVCNALHESLTQAILWLEPGFEPFMMSRGIRWTEPVFASFRLAEIRQGSFVARCRVAISPEVRPFVLNVGASLVAAAIWAVGASVGAKQTPQTQELPRPKPPLEVSESVVDMVKELNATGTNWHLRLRDESTGLEVEIESGSRR